MSRTNAELLKHVFSALLVLAVITVGTFLVMGFLR